jgi:hypothetical protein
MVECLQPGNPGRDQRKRRPRRDQCLESRAAGRCCQSRCFRVPTDMHPIRTRIFRPLPEIQGRGQNAARDTMECWNPRHPRRSLGVGATKGCVLGRPGAFCRNFMPFLNGVGSGIFARAQQEPKLQRVSSRNVDGAHGRGINDRRA